MTKIYIVNESCMSIGRDSFCTFAVPENDMLSRTHVVIVLKNGMTELQMQGKNGGYVGTRFICCGESVLLNSCDEIKLPLITFIYSNGLLVISSDYRVATKCQELTNDNYYNNDSYSLGMNIVGTNGLHNVTRDKQKPKLNGFTKAPRTVAVKDETPVEIESVPEKREETLQNKLITIGPSLTMVIPMLIGVIITIISSKSDSEMSFAFMYTGLISAVCSAVLGVTWSLMSLKERSKQIEAYEIKRQKLYREYIRNEDEKLKIKYIKNRNALLMMNPVVHDYFDETNAKYILWNRTKDMDDYLNIRLGLGSCSFDVPIIIPKMRFTIVDDELRQLPLFLKQKYAQMSDVPVCVNILDSKLTGVVAQDELKRECLFNLMVLMCACQSSPEELIAAVMLTKSNAKYDSYKKVSNGRTESFETHKYEYLRFLPHVQTEYGNMLAFSTDRANRIQNNIADLINEEYIIIIFTDDYSVLREEIKTAKNVYIIVLADSFEGLTGECKCIINYSDSFSGIISLFDNETKRQEVIFDEINIGQAENYIRRLQGLYSGRKEVISIPSSVSFFSMWQINNLLVEDILENWKENHTTSDISIPIGGDMDGTTYLDLSENSMGPHGLIAGMTGSGKSEILQTIILSLIYKYSPLEAGLFLIDYKGGGMATLFEGIPHVLGSISNLSGRVISRAMISIRSECERRQRIFLKSGVNKIAEYQEKYYRGELDEALPHIFIIIDEFAELKKEEPEFMNELISVARVGRSLGIHLILATQKPSGCVDDNIWSNSRFRISLRVQDKQDSNEMLHKPDAAYIKNVGRAYLQVGNDEIYKCFQGAYTGTRFSNENHKKQEVFLLDEFGNKITDSFYNVSKADNQTELELLCEKIKEANTIFETINSKSKSQNRLWLEPLSENLILTDCITNNSHQYNTSTITIGKYDDPRHQYQGYSQVNVINDGNVAILGEAKSGKSTLMQTMLFQLCKFSVEELYVYIADFSLSMLKPFQYMHMCGGYINEDCTENIKRLLLMLREEIQRRKRILQGGNFIQYKKNNNMPLIVVVIDGLAGFREYLSDDDEMLLLNLLKQSLTYGIYFYVTACEISTHEMSQRMFEKMNKVITLSLKDKYAYKEALRITGNDFILPEDICGRGIVKEGDEVVEMQIFEPLKALNDYERIEALENTVRNISSTANVGKIPLKIPVIPKIPTIQKLISDFNTENANASGKKEKCLIPLGYEIESGKIFSIDFFEGIILITGKAGSGRHTFLKMIHDVMNYMKGEKYKINLFVCEEKWEKNMPEAITLTCNKKKLRIVIYDDTLDFDLMDQIRSIQKGQLIVIHFGGEVDKCPYGDFSYIPFSRQCKALNRGVALVSKNEHSKFYGELKVPLAMEESDDIC